MDGYDRFLEGPRGAALRDAISATATEFDINPGLLVANAFSEIRGKETADIYTSPNPVQTQQIGLDDWGSFYGKLVRKHIPGASNIVSDPLSEHYINEAGRDTGPIHEFPDGPTALRALAGSLRFAEIQLERAMGRDMRNGIGTVAWADLPSGTKFALTRAYYNGGPGLGVKLAREAARGRDVLVTNGPPAEMEKGRLVTHPRRAATIHAAQAVHVSQKIFNKPVR